MLNSTYDYLKKTLDSYTNKQISRGEKGIFVEEMLITFFHHMLLDLEAKEKEHEQFLTKHFELVEERNSNRIEIDERQFDNLLSRIKIFLREFYNPPLPNNTQFVRTTDTYSRAILNTILKELNVYFTPNEEEDDEEEIKFEPKNIEQDLADYLRENWIVPKQKEAANVAYQEAMDDKERQKNIEIRVLANQIFEIGYMGEPYKAKNDVASMSKWHSATQLAEKIVNEKYAK